MLARATAASLSSPGGQRRAFQICLHCPPRCQKPSPRSAHRALRGGQGPLALAASRARYGLAKFIPLAEKTALIERITPWVVDEALRQAGTWQRQGLNLSVALKVSAADLDRPGLAGELCALLERHAVDPHRIELEFPESAISHRTERLRQHLLRIRSLGV